MTKMINTLIRVCLCTSVLLAPTHAIASDQQRNDAVNTTTFYLIRHTEKELDAGSDPDLTEQGHFRAEYWATVLKNVGVDKLYSTNTLRTRETAAPFAAQNDIEIEFYSPSDIDYADFVKTNLNKTVVVVGHSNTTPGFANGLLGREDYQDLDESNYSSLFVVDIIGETRIGRVFYIEAQISK
jgi:phosphohistidine phosphatase SixA